MTTRVSMLLKSRTLPDMLPFSLCNKKRLAIRHMNRPLFPTTLSIPSYNIRKQVRLRTYQHPLVIKELLNALRLKVELLWNMIFPLLPSAAAVIGVTVETINVSLNLNFYSALLVLVSHYTNANSAQQNVVQVHVLQYSVVW